MVVAQTPDTIKHDIYRIFKWKFIHIQLSDPREMPPKSKRSRPEPTGDGDGGGGGGGGSAADGGGAAPDSSRRSGRTRKAR